jgi:polyvinyl alcohol dehydrogenase (cytochrome)
MVGAAAGSSSRAQPDKASGSSAGHDAGAEPDSQGSGGSRALEPDNDAGPARDRDAIETDPGSADWPSYGHDLAQTRSNPSETKIGVANVAQLQLKWTWSTTAVTSTPVVRAGSVYFGDWQGNVVALDAKTGKETWRVAGSNQVVPEISGSLTVTDDAIYSGGDNAMLYRLTPKTGMFDWSVQLDDGGSSRTYDSPALIGNIVIAGVGSYQNINPTTTDDKNKPFRGSVVARDIATGAELWKFSTTDDTGSSVVSSPAIDPARKRVFIGTGQNYTGDSPYADSLLALDYETGKRVWSMQFTTNDIYSLAMLDGPDKDVLATPLLFSVDGRDLVGACDKGGNYYVLDRDGKSVWAKKLTEGGHHGGVMGSPAYANGVIFVCSGDFTTDMTFGAGQDGPAKSVLLALKAGDGSTLWSAPIDGACYGAVSHANGVVYLPTVSGHLRAFDAANGNPLWDRELGGSSAGGVSIVDGMLYVSYGWDWVFNSVQGGVQAYGLP